MLDAAGSWRTVMPRRSICATREIRELVDGDDLAAGADGEEVLGRGRGERDDPGGALRDRDRPVRGLERDREERPLLRGSRGAAEQRENRDRQQRRGELELGHEKPPLW